MKTYFSDEIVKVTSERVQISSDISGFDRSIKDIGGVTEWQLTKKNYLGYISGAISALSLYVLYENLSNGEVSFAQGLTMTAFIVILGYLAYWSFKIRELTQFGMTILLNNGVIGFSGVIAKPGNIQSGIGNYNGIRNQSEISEIIIAIKKAIGDSAASA